MTRRTIGVIGGMGPVATVDFLSRLIDMTAGDHDQDHLRVLVDSNPQVPDRTAFLTSRGPDPRPILLQMARGLERAGAELLVMPCNTAHAFAGDIQTAVSIPLVDWPEIVSDAAAAMGVTGAGLLGSAGTIATGIYQAPLLARGIAPVVPTQAQQSLVTRAIYGLEGVKRTGPRSPAARTSLLEAAAALPRRGADALILACTEFSAMHAAAPLETNIPVLDPSEIVARHVVMLAGSDQNPPGTVAT